MVIENWVSSTNEHYGFKNNRSHLPHLWYQFNDKNELRKAQPDKAENQNIDFFRDLGPIQRKIIQQPE